MLGTQGFLHATAYVLYCIYGTMHLLSSFCLSSVCLSQNILWLFIVEF